MALKEDLKLMLIDDKKKLEETTEKLKSLTQEEIELRKSIESTEYLLNHKFGSQVDEVNTESKLEKVISEIDESAIIAYKSIPDGAFKIMSEAKNKPLHAKEIYRQLTEKGKKIGHPGSVGAGLSRDYRFKRLGQNMFTIIEEYYKKEENLNEKKESAPVVQEDRTGDY